MQFTILSVYLQAEIQYFAQIIKRLNSDYCTESVFFSSLEISPILYWMVAELLAGYLIVTPT